MTGAFPDLLRFILDHDWAQGLVRLNSHPNEAGYVDEHGMTCLHYACCSSKVSPEFVKGLVKAFPQACLMKDFQGYTPLHYSCSLCSTHPKVVSCLIKSAVSTVYKRDNFDRMPLHLLIQGNEFLILKAIQSFRCKTAQAGNQYTPTISPDENPELFSLWTKASHLIMAAYHGTIGSQLTQYRSFQMLHACAAIPDCPLRLIQLVLVLHPEQATQMDDDGHIPIQIVAARHLVSVIYRVKEEDNQDSNERMILSSNSIGGVSSTSGKPPLTKNRNYSSKRSTDVEDKDALIFTSGKRMPTSSEKTKSNTLVLKDLPKSSMGSTTATSTRPKNVSQRSKTDGAIPDAEQRRRNKQHEQTAQQALEVIWLLLSLPSAAEQFQHSRTKKLLRKVCESSRGTSRNKSTAAENTVSVIDAQQIRRFISSLLVQGRANVSATSIDPLILFPWTIIPITERTSEIVDDHQLLQDHSFESTSVPSMSLQSAPSGSLPPERYTFTNKIEQLNGADASGSMTHSVASINNQEPSTMDPTQESSVSKSKGRSNLLEDFQKFKSNSRASIVSSKRVRKKLSKALVMKNSKEQPLQNVRVTPLVGYTIISLSKTAKVFSGPVSELPCRRTFRKVQRQYKSDSG